MRVFDRRTWIGLLLACVAGGSAWAQIPDSLPRLTPIPVGKFLIYPLFSTQVERTNNLRFVGVRPDRGIVPTEATVVSVVPGVLAELPFQRSELRLGYAARYREYHQASIENNVSHFFLAEGRLVFGTGAFVEFAEDFQRGVLDTQRFDPGGEITFQEDKFERNTTLLGFGHTRGRSRTIGLRVSRDDVRFLERRSGYFDTEWYGLGVYGEHGRGERLHFLWELQGATADLSRIRVGAEDLRQEDEVAARLGARWAVAPGTRLEGRIGWSRNEFESPTSSTFSGVVGTLTISRMIPTRARLVARLEQTVYPSIYANNDYYESSQLTVQVDSPPGTRVTIGANARYFLNRYPESSPDREDRILEATAWIGYRFRAGLEWRMYSTIGSRSSTAPEPEVDYEARRFGTTLRLGG